MNESSDAILGAMNPWLIVGLIALIAIMLWQGAKEIWAFYVRLRELDAAELEANAEQYEVSRERPEVRSGHLIGHIGQH